MTLCLPGRLSGTLLLAGIITLGSLASSESVICWLAGAPLKTRQTDHEAVRAVRKISWSADGTKLLSQSRGHDHFHVTLTLHDLTVPAGRGLAWNGHLGISAFDAALSPDAQKVLLATEHGELWWVDLATLKATEFAKSPDVPFQATAVSHDGCRLAGATERGKIYLCQATEGTSIVLDPRKPVTVSQLRFSQDDQQLMAAKGDGSIEIWDTRTGTLVRSLRAQCGANGAAFMPDGAKVISGFGECCVKVSDVATGAERWRQPHGLSGSCGVCRLDVSPEESIVAWAGVDQRVVVWDITRAQKRFEFENPAVVLNISFSPNGKLLAVAGCESLVRIYDTETGREVRKIDTSLPREI